MADILERFLSVIYGKNMLQSKYLENFLTCLRKEEREDLRCLIEFYRSLGYSIEDIAENYLFILQMFMEETKYFVEHGTYRYSTLKDVSADVYFNPEYMMKYMMGLALSTYLLNNHLDNMRWFIEFIDAAGGENYLEVGPGHGEYFLKAIKRSHLKHFHAVDISPTSVDITRKYVKFCGGGGSLNIEQGDFLSFVPDRRYDVIVMCEVLEHVEDPRRFLSQIQKISHEGSRSYVTTVVDAPARDHIYHFHTVEEIFDVVKAAGLRVVAHKLITYNNEPLETVRKKHRPIIVPMILGI